MENISLQEAVEIIKEYRSKDIALRIAVFGPPESGKTDFLQQLMDFCDREKKYPITTISLDLKKIPTNSVNDFYRVLFTSLKNKINEKGIKLDDVFFPSKLDLARWDLAFENLVEELLKKTTSDVYLFIDHIDTISFQLARVLVTRIREFDDKIEKDYNYKRLGLCIAGIKTLFELRSAFSSPYISCNIIKFPRQDKLIQDEIIKDFMRQEAFTDKQINKYLDDLRNLSGGETVFLRPLLEYIKSNPKRAKAHDLNEHIHNLNLPVFRHIALRVWSDLRLQTVVRNLVNQKPAPVNGSNPEIDEFQLTGAVIATERSYLFRNDLVKQFLTPLIYFLDGILSPEDESSIPRHILELEKINKICQQTPNLSVFMENLENAWREITDYNIESKDIFIKCFGAYRNGDSFRYVQKNPLLEVKKVQIAANPYEVQVEEIINDWKTNLNDWFQKKHTFFLWTDDLITFTYVLRPAKDFLFGLSVSVERNKVNREEEFTEFTLGHWVRFIKRYRERIIQLVLQEIGENELGNSIANEKKQNPDDSGVDNYFTNKHRTTLYWTKENTKFLTTSSSFNFLKGKSPTSKIADVNKEFQEIFNGTDISPASLKRELGKISRSFYLEFKDAINDIEELQKLDETDALCVESYPEGLSIPIELIPFRKNSDRDYLTTRIAVSRRLRFEDKPLNFHMPFHLQVAELQKRGEPFRVLIVADDKDGELEEVAVEAETVENQLKEAQVIVAPPLYVKTIEDIEDALSKEKFHLLHFCGHAEYFSGDEKKSGISIPSRKGGTRNILHGRFAQAVKNSGLMLVYLSCCYGAASDIPEIGQTYLNCMEALIWEGIPNVVGFRWAIEDKSARQFAEEFYTELFGKNQVKELNLAMLETRKKLWNQPQCLDVVASSILVSQTD